MRQQGELLARLADGHWSDQIEAVESAGDLLAAGVTGGDFATALSGHFKHLAGDEHAELRKAVARALRYLDDEDAAPLLEQLAEDSDRYVCKAAETTRDQRQVRGRAVLHHDDNAEIIERLYGQVEQCLKPKDRKLLLRLADELNHHFVREAYHELVRIITPLEMDLAQLVKKTSGSADMATNAGGAYRKLKMLTGMLEDLRIFTADGTREKQPVDLAVLVREAAAAAELGSAWRTDRHIIDIDIPEDLTLEASAHRLLQALGNLLTNALEAMPEGGRITIRAARTGANGVLITIEDTGSGMSPQNVRDCVVMFTSGKRDGLGMGLPLAK
ncbi:MAG: ATP-binding protein, partial [Planctomycetota bacterium]|nr:ATP-binding protein [Planctomycetota bacterium]